MVKAQFLPLWLGKPFIFWCPVQIPLRAYPGPGPAGLLAVSPAHQARSLLRVLFLLPRIMALCFLMMWPLTSFAQMSPFQQSAPELPECFH